MTQGWMSWGGAASDWSKCGVRIGRSGYEKKVAHLEHTEITLEGVPEENCVVVEQLGELDLDVGEACRDALELLGRQSRVAGSARVSQHRMSETKNKTRTG